MKKDMKYLEFRCKIEEIESMIKMENNYKLNVKNIESNLDEIKNNYGKLEINLLIDRLSKLKKECFLLLINDFKAKNSSVSDYQIYDIFRQRWDKEDNLLNTRTGVFLTANTILFVAASQTKIIINGGNGEIAIVFGFFIAFIGLAITCLWMKVSKRTSDFTGFYSKICDSIDYKIFKFPYDYKCPKWYPNKILSEIFPKIILYSWIAYFVFILTGLIINIFYIGGIK